MTLARGGLAFTLGCLVAGGQAWAAEHDPVLQQKLALVERLIAALPAADGHGHLDEARGHLARARVHQARGDHAGADAELDQAMRHLAKARRAGPDGGQRDERDAFSRIALGMESLLEAYRQSVERIDRQDPRRASAQTHFDQVVLMMEQARRLAAEQVRAATSMLQAAQKTLLQGYDSVIGGDTVVYAQHFATPAEEYRYELARNRSYQDLIPVAQAELRPGADALRAMDELVAANRVQLGLAERRAAERDYPAAVASLRTGTQALQRALLQAGLALPGAATDGAPR